MKNYNNKKDDIIPETFKVKNIEVRNYSPINEVYKLQYYKKWYFI